MMQLAQQGKLRVSFDFEDISPNGDFPLFQCSAMINGETVGVAQAPSKKKARAMAAEKAQAAAFEKNLVMVWDPPELRANGDEDDGSAP
jgi:dsRNA-specific ribonuclease